MSASVVAFNPRAALAVPPRIRPSLRPEAEARAASATVTTLPVNQAGFSEHPLFAAPSSVCPSASVRAVSRLAALALHAAAASAVVWMASEAYIIPPVTVPPAVSVTLGAETLKAAAAAYLQSHAPAAPVDEYEPESPAPDMEALPQAPAPEAFIPAPAPKMETVKALAASKPVSPARAMTPPKPIRHKTLPTEPKAPPSPLKQEKPLVKRAVPKELKQARPVKSTKAVAVRQDEPLRREPSRYEHEERRPAPSASAAPSSSAAKEALGAAPVAEQPKLTPASFGAAYLNNPAPAYPKAAKRDGAEGRVMLKVHVSAAGTAESVTLAASSGHSSLDNAALEAVKRWRFVPAKRGSEPVAADVMVPVMFSLE